MASRCRASRCSPLTELGFDVMGRRAVVAIRTLAGFAVLVDDEEVRLSQWGSRRARQLCKRLAAARGEPVAREQLIDLLWPDGNGSDRLGARLSVQLSAVRRILHGGVIADSASVRLDLRHVRLDVAELRDAMTAGDLCRVVGLYRGDFLPEDLYEDWAAAAREQARSAFMTACRRLARTEADNGHHERAVELTLSLLIADPYDDSAHQCVVVGLAAGGRLGEAQRAHRAYAGRMDELGVRSVPLAELVPALALR
jgi:DNA-binding SARP family transcriptional activator